MDARLLQHYQQRLGLKSAFASALIAEQGILQPWRVAVLERGRCGLLGIDADEALVERDARPGSEALAVGDWVVLDESNPESPQVDRVLERMTWLARGSAHREGDVQLIAANLDTVFIVVAFAQTAKLEQRSLRARRLDRFIAAVREGGATPVVLVNKVDITTRDDDELDAFRSALAARLGDVDVLCVSAHEQRGLDALAHWLGQGDTVAFLGPSGVGKSSLINALLGEARQSIGEVRAVDTKGRHTTTRRELLVLPTGALLIDTPGVREFAVVTEDAAAGFPDIAALAEECKFSDCEHDTEPDCAVRVAVEDGRLPSDRLESYRDLRRDGQRLLAKQDPYARHLERNEQRRFGRMVRDAMAIKRSR